MISSLHYNAFKKLKPIKTDVEDAAVALEFDRCYGEFNIMYKEAFAGTASSTLSKWEDLYELSHDGSIAQRRQLLLAALNRESGIAERHYIALAASLGFTIKIQAPPRMLRAGLGRAGFPVYEPDMQYTWTVSCDSSEEDAEMLIRVLEEQKIPFTRIFWVFKMLGALYDEETGLVICDEETGLPIYDEELKN